MSRNIHRQEIGPSRRAEITSALRLNNATNAVHIGLRGVDTTTFAAINNELVRPLLETVICCDYGRDHEQMTQNGTRNIFSLEQINGNFHADWSTDDLNRIPQTNGFGRIFEGLRRDVQQLLIIPFKNTPNIEQLRNDPDRVRVLAPSYELVHYLDSKLNLPEILARVGIEAIPGEIIDGSEITNNYQILSQKYGKKLVLQAEYGSGGSGTFFAENQLEFDSIMAKFGSAKIKVSKFIKGASLNGQACVFSNSDKAKTIVFSPSFQIIGLQEISDWPTYYCGNEYSGTCDYLKADGVQSYINIMERLGNHFATLGWKGIFGVDLIYDEDQKKVYVLEINPRMQSSTSFLHMILEQAGQIGIGTYHLLSYLNEGFDFMALENPIVNLVGSHVLINNKFGSDMIATGSIEAGIYSVKDFDISLRNKLIHMLSHFWHAPSDGEVLISCGVPSLGTRIENHGTILKAYSKMAALINGDCTKLSEKYAREVVEPIYRMMDLKPA